jgi:hypothetical protein
METINISTDEACKAAASSKEVSHLKLPNVNNSTQFDLICEQISKREKKNKSSKSARNKIKNVNKSDFITTTLTNKHTSAETESKENKIYSDSRQFIEPEFLTINNNYEKKVGENFCESFFISGLPYIGSRLINKSEEYIPPCSHGDCAILPAFKPDILFRYPENNSKEFELNNSVF